MRLPMTHASTDQLVWMCSSPKYALRSGLRAGTGSVFDVCAVWPVDADSGVSAFLQEIKAPMQRRTNAKTAVAATLVFMNVSIFLNARPRPRVGEAHAGSLSHKFKYL